MLFDLVHNKLSQKKTSNSLMWIAFRFPGVRICPGQLEFWSVNVIVYKKYDFLVKKVYVLVSGGRNLVTLSTLSPLFALAFLTIKRILPSHLVALSKEMLSYSLALCLPDDSASLSWAIPFGGNNQKINA